jgi:hypothetical protein
VPTVRVSHLGLSFHEREKGGGPGIRNTPGRRVIAGRNCRFGEESKGAWPQKSRNTQVRDA